MESNLLEILAIIKQLGGLASLDADQDFYEAGVSSVQSLPLLMQIEDEYSISIPDERFTEIRTARQLSALVGELHA